MLLANSDTPSDPIGDRTMLNTRQARAAAHVRATKPASLTHMNREQFRDKVHAAAHRVGVADKDLAQFEQSAGWPAELAAIL